MCAFLHFVGLFFLSATMSSKLAASFPPQSTPILTHSMQKFYLKDVPVAPIAEGLIDVAEYKANSDTDVPPPTRTHNYSPTNYTGSSYPTGIPGNNQALDPPPHDHSMDSPSHAYLQVNI